jgi:hypothetical protein
MKKITLLVLTLIITITTYSQSFYKIFKSTKSEYRDEKWITIATYYPTDEFVILDNTNISISNYKFKVYGDYEKTEFEEHKTLTWKAINANGDKCYFMMKLFNPNITSHIIYSIIYESGVMYEYETEN